MDQDKPGIDEIFFGALDMPTIEERSAYLDDACGTDAQLRERVERLLRAQPNVESFLESPAPELSPTLDQPALDPTITEKPGTQIGPYKLLQQIGEGGMGMVYMAEQAEPVERRVALKIIKPGMDTRQVIARFEAERQALAMMDHPNIARVLDAGTTDSGRPYFVMELVKGIPINRYCDEQHLTPKERLGLFIPICQAVQHAHQKGIIHRDLKPSNVLVARYDDRAVPKVIDFGVAKATAQRLTEKTMFTEYGQIVGTLEYMSPEQAQVNQLDIDTRSDIYSLGVLLYELLTGATPFDRQRLRSAAFDEMLRIIREEEPPRPSTRLSTIDTLPSVAANRHIEPHKLSTMLRGELDWIVMKALEKDRGRRYETATGFAADIERYLNDEPVVACPPSPAYRFRKFARRNKALLTTIALVAVTLVLGVVVSTSQAIRATRSAARERAARQEANEQRDAAVEAKRRVEEAKRRIGEQNKQISRQLASTHLDRGQAECERGQIGDGMLWMAHALEILPDDATALRKLCRTNLAAWYPRLHRLRAVLEHQGPVNDVACNPDGARILTGSSDRTARLWDASTGKPIGQTLQHEDAVRVVTFNDDGSQILTGTDNGTTRLWTADGKPLGEPVWCEAPILAIGFSNDGLRAVTQSENNVVQVRDAATGKPIGKPLEHPARILATAFSSDGNQVITGGEANASRVWDAATGEQIGDPFEAPHVVTAVAFNADGSQLLIGSKNSWVRFWDATAHEALGFVWLDNVPTDIALTPDGSRLMAGGQFWDRVCLDNPDSPGNKTIGQPLVHQDWVPAVAISLDGSCMVTGSLDHTARVWEPAKDPNAAQPLPYANEGKRYLESVAFSPNGLHAIRAEGRTARLWEVATGEPVGSPLEHDDLVTAVAYSPDGSKILTGGADHIAQLWDAATQRPISQGLKLDSSVTDVAFSRDGAHFVTAAFGKAAQVWDVSTGRPIGKPMRHEAELWRVAYSHSDRPRIATGPCSGAARLWDATSGDPVGEIMQHGGDVVALAFSPDGRLLVGGTAGGANTARLWNAENGQPIGRPMQHKSGVWDVEFSPDGTQVLTASDTARLWDVATCRPIGPPLAEHKAGIGGIAFSPDGSSILANSDKSTQLWRAPPSAVEGDVERIVCWVHVVTGLELDVTADPEPEVRVLDAATWHRYARRLQDLGGLPMP